MIVTKYNITLEIDAKQYNITVREPSRQEAEEFKRLFAEKTASFNSAIEDEKELANIEIELSAKRRILELNSELIKDGTLIEKAKIITESIALARQIADLSKHKNAIKKPDTSALIDAIESIEAHKFDVLVSGDDALSLKTDAASLNIGFNKLWEEMRGLVGAANAKK